MAKCIPCDVEGKERVYVGETSRNIDARSLEHYNDLKNNSDKSFMKKHILKEHRDNKHEVNFKWKVLRKFKKPLQRQLYEACKINSLAENVILNSKQEFNSINIESTSNNNLSYQCDECGAFFKEMNNMKLHKISFHKPVKCKVCSYEALGLTDLKYHNKHFHDQR